MTHFPYVIASYGLTAMIALVFTLQTLRRLKRDKIRLSQLEAQSSFTSTSVQP